MQPALPRYLIAMDIAALAMTAVAMLPCYAGQSEETSRITDMAFRDFYRRPVGPRGLEPSDRLIAASGTRVRLHGYVVAQEAGTRGMFLLSPVPVRLSEEADGPADDLPASVVFVHASELKPEPGSYIAVAGRLEIGRAEERDGRVSWIRLRTEPDIGER